MKTKSRHGENAYRPDAQAPTRERILDAAFKTFLKRGYDRASTLEIATEAKVSKRELYTHFRNKAALFAAGIKKRTETMRVPLAEPDLSTVDALARTLGAYGISLLSGVTHPYVLAVHRLVIAESQRTPALAVILDREGRQANVSALASVMRDALARGHLRGEDPDRLASVFSALLWGDLLIRLLLRVEREPSAAEIRRRSQEATKAFLKLHGPPAQP